MTTEKRADRQYDVEFRDVSFRYPNALEDAWGVAARQPEVQSRLTSCGSGHERQRQDHVLYDPIEGQILLNGIDIRKYRYDEYMRIFAVVFQDFRLFALPLGQNVAAGAHYGSERVMDCLSKADFGDRLKTLPDGLDTPLYKELDKNGVEVSGGEAQKIAIAGDKTAVYISHRLSSCKFCDDIAVFDHGAIVQYGTHDQLVADENGKYYELWHAQAQYYVKEYAPRVADALSCVGMGGSLTVPPMPEGR